MKQIRRLAWWFIAVRLAEVVVIEVVVVLFVTYAISIKGFQYAVEEEGFTTVSCATH